MFGAFGAGMAFQFMGDVAESRRQADLIIREIDSKSEIEYDLENPDFNDSPHGEIR